MTVEMKSYIGCESGHALSVTIRINSYPQRDLENDREEGVTADIYKGNKCDGDKETNK